MPKTHYWIIILATFFSHVAIAQQLPVAVNFQQSYREKTRSTDGAPGRYYWQNGGQYDIKVNIDPVSRELTGVEGIDYINNSPDTLKYLVFKLYPNLYQEQAMRNVPISVNDLTKGVSINSIHVDGVATETKSRVIRGTNMYLKGVQVLPGQKIHVAIDYGYTINKTSFQRTGQVDTGAFMIAYFFPRIAVYDDIDGWNEYPYVGKEEFYNDYCDFNVDIAVRGDYAVWATGELVNKVYQPQIEQKITAALQSDTVVDIISTKDWENHAVLKPDSMHYWQFSAKNVTDFAFGMSNHYVWKASGVEVDKTTKRRVMANAVFNPAHESYLPVAENMRKVLHLISYKAPGIPFPYPHETIFEGLDAMEYPMMVNNLNFEGDEGVAFTIHEMYHTLFPFYVGNNETKYSFMDEGWATFSEFMFPKEMGIKDVYDLSSINNSAGTDVDMPVMTPTAQLYGAARFSNKDLKPALGFRYVHELLGEELFYKAVRYYIEQWHGKHPTPYDFFACMNKGAGVNMDWFWQNWYFEKHVPDLGIDKVSVVNGKYAVVVKRIGMGMVPVHLGIVYADGSQEWVKRSIGCWKDGKRSVVLNFTAKKKVERLVLGDGYDADIDQNNNIWTNYH